MRISRQWPRRAPRRDRLRLCVLCFLRCRLPTADCLLPTAYCLLRVELHDELFLHWQIDLLAGRHGADLGRDLPGVELEPLRDTPAFDLLHRMHDCSVLPARCPHPAEVARLDRERRDAHLPAVHGEVAVAHELTALRARGREPAPVDDVVEPPLEQLQQRLAGDAARPLRLLEVETELVLEDAVNALDLLLLAQLDAVAGQLRFARLAVLPGREVALLDRALLRVAALTLEEQLHPLAAAQPAYRSDISRHLSPFAICDSRFVISLTSSRTSNHKSPNPHTRIKSRITNRYTRRRLGGRQPLCGIGVTSRIDFTSMPTVCSARIADSRPDPGPFTRTSTERNP